MKPQTFLSLLLRPRLALDWLGYFIIHSVTFWVAYTLISGVTLTSYSDYWDRGALLYYLLYIVGLRIVVEIISRLSGHE
jgi:hypothetical protein